MMLQLSKFKSFYALLRLVCECLSIELISLSQTITRIFKCLMFNKILKRCLINLPLKGSKYFLHIVKEETFNRAETVCLYPLLHQHSMLDH